MKGLLVIFGTTVILLTFTYIAAFGLAGVIDALEKRSTEDGQP